MRETTTAEGVLEELARGCPLPPHDEARGAYQPVEVYDEAGWPWPGSVTGWWTSPEGVTACRLRLSGVATPRWVLYDTDRIILRVQSGT
ncbi:hypothetical protein ABT288_40490 [Streptomyces sp. NPDC001093]|uniref:hypothetical protein n=1 Tax=Streptomyces sp. NPDC001093 TaxID=3154376 RepID=UPI003328D24D